MAVNGVEIQVGQQWKMRDGRLCTVTQHDSADRTWPWLITFGSRGGDWVRDDGRESDAELGGHDLVQLVPLNAEQQITLEGVEPTGYTLSAPGYDKLADVLKRAFDQASGGKGKERHASAGVAFEDQPMSTINDMLGSIDGFIYQAHKKSLESKRLPLGRAQAELLGAINYLAGAVIALDRRQAEGGAQ